MPSRRGQRWRARVKVDRIIYHLGTYDDYESARDREERFRRSLSVDSYPQRRNNCSALSYGGGSSFASTMATPRAEPIAKYQS